MVRYFKKHANVLASESSDRNVLCGGTVNPDGTYSYCIINCSDEAQDVEFSTEYPVDKPFRVYTYDSNNVPYNDFGDFQAYTEVEASANGDVNITMNPNSLVIMTTDYIDRTPAKISTIRVEANKITWNVIDDEHHCYYRVFEDGVQIASTVAEYLEVETKPGAKYTVKAVDKYGNM